MKRFLDLAILPALAGALTAAPAAAQACHEGWVPAASTGSGGVWGATVFDDGSGPTMYAVGDFVSAQGNHVSRWNGSGWEPLGAGLQMGFFEGFPATFGDDAVAYDDGHGPALFVGGCFHKAGTVGANHVARWDGTWSALGSGLAANAGTEAAVFALAVFDDGHGPALYAGGQFTKAGGAPALNVARWDGTNWSPLGSGLTGLVPDVEGFASFDDGSGPALYVTGRFSSAGGHAVSNIARWDGTDWSDVGGGLDGAGSALGVFDDGNGPALYASGFFSHAGGVSASRIARWDGTQWSAVGSGFDAPAYGLTAFDDGTGPALYAGGSFLVADGQQVNRITKWDGSAWSWLDAGIGFGNDGDVQRILPFDGGSGPGLFVFGSFIYAGGVPAMSVAHWACAPVSPWTFLGSGLKGTSSFPNLIGSGSLLAGTEGTLKLLGARKSALSALLVSLSSTPAPFKGGVLVPVPVTLTLSMLTSSQGSILLPFTWPAGVPSGLDFWLQLAIADPVAIHGVALSNALQATVP
jgi:hypothetical protein